MNKLSAVVLAATMAFGGAALADGHAGQGFNMLQTALMNDLERLGIDPSSMGDDLTLGEIASIKSVIDSNENESQKKNRIQAIIDNN
ncbi:hypothetical protein MWU52_00025 [Jannaschia sp. S6380]|uniref:hypothetical protein n=1 Tax=Jannaschia sp. S6380 TaxID=2926408 RepID=UPI001FF259BF|nr:hypothetical protein [Jannaschia sp. S6380]MCK0165926.1 hypothetical protein [Jannaschia sp. S6380]